MSYKHDTVLKMIYIYNHKICLSFSQAYFFASKISKYLFFQIAFVFPLLIPSFSQLPLIFMHMQYSLLRPLTVHPRLSGEGLYHLLLFLGEGGHGAGGWCGYWDGECTLGVFRAGFHHKQLIIHYTKTGGKMRI